MIRHGVAPFLECSGRGDKRFSAFFARIKARGNKSIEELYQSSKIFHEREYEYRVNWRKAKGMRADNQADCNNLYTELWNEYIRENPKLLPVLKAATGLSDIFGQEGHCCQATELWRIRNRPSEEDCPGHVASELDPKRCGICDIYIDALRLSNERLD
jgi:hypothetical protein